MYSEHYPIGGSIEPYDIITEDKLLNEILCNQPKQQPSTEVKSQ